MSDAALRVEGLSKQYRIGRLQNRSRNLKEAMSESFRKLLHRRDGEEESTIWALNDVNFELKQGEVLGIIGRNGSGKSTLLKILSGITKPTRGKATLHGRISSLLEVGTGFHADLTGRENIFLNGAILGMSRREIERKFDEIVAFSEIEQFIDTPVKRYSSGMYVRLAFAVAAHLEPDVLILDEVLAVGDLPFQQKCLGKMGQEAKEGRTVLFVSHSMAAIQAMTTRCILLESGKVVMDSVPGQAVHRYIHNTFHVDIERVSDLWNHPGRLPDMVPSLKQMWMTDAGGNIITTAPMGGEVYFHVEYETDDIVRQPIIRLTFENPEAQRAFAINNKMTKGARIVNGPPRGIFTCRIPRLPLVAGEYFITAAFGKTPQQDADRIIKAYRLTVVHADVYGTGAIPDRMDGMGILFDADWEFKPIEGDAERFPLPVSETVSSNL
ncbi:MAG: ABC transporter ATP-binding protein [Armatimonadetes bacterium]|nr:ABC transporter ATP-binding protein [Armatimonadota bacterium]